MGHIIITGTGRAGTTFLVQLYTLLGFDTGFKNIKDGVHNNCNAGMEINPFRTSNMPYIIKNPVLCDRLDEFIEKGNKVDKVIIPIRDIDSATMSRIKVQGKSEEGVKGGLWCTNNADEQKTILLEKFYKLMFSISKHNLPHIFILFPKMINDPKYLYKKLFNGIIRIDTFKKNFYKIADPKLVSRFKD